MIVRVHRILHLLSDSTGALCLVSHDDKAAYLDTMQAVQELLGLGVAKDEVDDDGNTALQLAVQAQSIQASCSRQAALYCSCQMHS